MVSAEGRGRKTLNKDDCIHDLVSKVKQLAADKGFTPTRTEFVEYGATDYQIRLVGGYEAILKMAGLEPRKNKSSLKVEYTPPKVLIFDIETAPIMAYVWGLWDQNVGLNQIVKDWYVLSWSAKWLGSPESEVMYVDQRDNPKMSDDLGIISQIWQLLDEADVVVTQNGKRFDAKKLNARFIQNGFPPPSSYRHVDTFQIARKVFAFTSNKLEYMTDKLCKKYKKLKHSKFAGFELWSECLNGNREAWQEMEIYNRYDVLSLEELYLILRPWDNSINFDVFHENFDNICSCGSKAFLKIEPKYTNTGKFDRVSCQGCGTEHTIKGNLLSKEKRKSLMK